MIITSRASFVLADNPGLMTLDGTNTWVLREPGAQRSVVVDPGPLIDTHLAAITEVASDVALTLVTHHHEDHTEAVPRFAELSGAPTRAFDKNHTINAEPLNDGEVIDIDGLKLRIVATPGHTADSMCVVLPDDHSVLTGDTILGRGTTIITYPDGQLGPYLETLKILQRIVDDENIERLLPAHGPVINNPKEVLDYYLAHRLERLEQVRNALAAGAETAHDVVAIVYADVDRSLWPAAERSVQAQLEYLKN